MDTARLGDASDPREALAAALASPGPCLVDVPIAREQNVYPMVPPGAAVDQLIRRPKPAVMQGYSGVQPSW